MEKFLPFQRKIIRAVENPVYDTVCLCGPRSLGKTFAAGHILARCLTPGDPLHQPGKTYVLAAASLDQARLTYANVRKSLEPSREYRWIDSATRLGATHIKTNTKLRAISSNYKTSFGLVDVPLLTLDEPAALEIVGGQNLSDSLITAQGKPNSNLKLFICGTLAPTATGPGHWWFDLVMKGTTGRTFVMLFQGNPATWDSWNTIRKANPLTRISKSFRSKLLEERDAARRDPRLKARFNSYRNNLPNRDTSTMLLTTADYTSMTSRLVPPRRGKPVIGYDLANGRAWNSATAIFENGRIECLAVAPGIPDLETQEKRDRVVRGTYAKLESAGRLLVEDGVVHQTAKFLHEHCYEAWGPPQLIVADRFKFETLRPLVRDCPLIRRISRWSEASEDIGALRKMAADGPLSVEETSRSLLRASLSVSEVKNDDQGSVRLVKKGFNNCSRDDISASLVLAAGVLHRRMQVPRKPMKWAVL